MNTRRKRRRQQQLQTTVIFVVAATLLFIILFTQLSTTTVSGSKEMDVRYVSVLVQENDTLWDLASEYINGEFYEMDDFMDTIIEVNGLRSERILAGQRITIPVVNAEDDFARN